MSKRFPNRRTLAAILLLCTALLSCGDTASPRLTIEALARGTKARDVKIDGATLRLTRAEIAFGPLYLCATESAESELCDTALAELLASQVVDGLAPQSQALGNLEATTGSVRSGFFDYGISWGLSQQGPSLSEGAGDHSARLEGKVELDTGEKLRFVADIDINPLSAGDAAVNGLRTRHDLSANTARMSVIFDPNAWLRRVKREALLELVGEDGEIQLVRGSQPYEAILQGMTVNATPELSWEDGR